MTDLRFCPACSPHAEELPMGEECTSCGAVNDGSAFREACAVIEWNVGVDMCGRILE